MPLQHTTLPEKRPAASRPDTPRRNSAATRVPLPTPADVNAHRRRECHCKRARHQHGTRGAYNRDQCRCAPCTAANAVTGRRQRLRAAQHAWNETSEWVPATGTRRRLQALAADGWSAAQLAALLDVSRGAVAQLRSTGRDRVLATTAAAVSHLYNECWWQTPPSPQHYQDRAAAAAERNGWAASWRWQGLDLDDPSETPPPKDEQLADQIAVDEARHGHDHGRLPRPERRAATAALTAAGHSAEHIAELLHVSARTVVRDRQVAA